MCRYFLVTDKIITLFMWYILVLYSNFKINSYITYILYKVKRIPKVVVKSIYAGTNIIIQSEKRVNIYYFVLSRVRLSNIVKCLSCF